MFYYFAYPLFIPRFNFFSTDSNVQRIFNIWGVTQFISFTILQFQSASGSFLQHPRLNASEPSQQNVSPQVRKKN
jgi:hypothetical protein